ERTALRIHLDVVGIVYEAQFNWRHSAKCRVKPKLFGDEPRRAAYGLSRTSVDRRTKIPDRVDEDVIDIARVRSVTGDPDWQPRVKPHSERQAVGCRFPVTKAHLRAIADQARLGGHPIRFEEWLCWEGGRVVRHPRCAKDLHGWSWEYRRKQR